MFVIVIEWWNIDLWALISQIMNVTLNMVPLFNQHLLDSCVLLALYLINKIKNLYKSNFFSS